MTTAIKPQIRTIAPAPIMAQAPGRLPVDVRATDHVHVRLRNGWTSLASGHGQPNAARAGPSAARRTPSTSPTISKQSEATMTPRELTPRQAAVIDLVCQGLMNKEIARQLHLSSRTVEVHRAKAMRVIGARTVPDAVRIRDRMQRDQAAMKAAPAAPQATKHNRPNFKVWPQSCSTGTKITRNGDFFAIAATPEIAAALALALDAGQLVFDNTVPLDLQDDIAAILWPDQPKRAPKAPAPSGEGVGGGGHPHAPTQSFEALLSSEWEA